MITQPNQSILDVICQQGGDLEMGMTFCILNDVRISDIPVPGTDLKTVATGTNTAALKYLAENNVQIGTARSATMPASCLLPSGVTFTEIGTDHAYFKWDNPTFDTFYYSANGSGIAPEYPTYGSGSHGGSNAGVGSLMPNTTYYLFINHKCGSDSFSPWLKIPFTTASE